METFIVFTEKKPDGEIENKEYPCRETKPHNLLLFSDSNFCDYYHVFRYMRNPKVEVRLRTVKYKPAGHGVEIDVSHKKLRKYRKQAMIEIINTTYKNYKDGRERKTETV